MTIFHRQLPANRAGRDFVVGDLHGCLDLLQEELGRVGFNTTCDRLFSVGDLIDRGPDSLGCLRLLNEPWFYAVRGNHEDMFLEYKDYIPMPYESNPTAEMFFGNGGRWALGLSEAENQELRHELLPKVRALPFALTVGNGASMFHVVHAELMTGNPNDNFSAHLFDPPPTRVAPDILIDDQMTEEVLSRVTEPLLWGRRVIRKFQSKTARRCETPLGRLLFSEQAMRPGLSLTYVGHTIVPEMILHASHFFIDRGACKRKPESRLLMLCHSEVLAWLE